MRKMLRKNTEGTAYINLLIVMLILLSCMVVFEHTLFTEGMENLGGVDPLIYDRERYTNMTREERIEYLEIKHGGSYELEWHWGLHWDWVPIGDAYYHYPDGFVIRDNDWEELVSGEMDPNDVSILDILGGALTWDFRVFEMLGILGIIIRILLVLFMIILIYLMLPLTG